MSPLFALQQASLWLAVAIAIALFAGLLVPYLFEEISRGKIELGPNLPTGAGDARPGYRGNPTPGQFISETSPDERPLSLRSFHIVLMLLSMVLLTATGVWGLLNNQVLLGAVSLGVAVLLIAYGTYFVSKAERIHLE